MSLPGLALFFALAFLSHEVSAPPCALLLGTAPAAVAQRTTLPESKAVKAAIRAFFEGMRRADSAAVRRTLAPGAVFHTLSTTGGGEMQLRPESPAAFLRAVGRSHPAVWDERITFEQVLIDANLASVWTPYEFYLGSTFSHCGYNSFQLVKLADGWKIAHIIDTRRKEKCK